MNRPKRPAASRRINPANSKEPRLRKNRSLLYIDKPIEIELPAGATLKLTDGETTQESVPGIATDHGAPKKRDELVVGGEYDLSLADKAPTNEVSFGWKPPINLIQRNNRNHLSDVVK